jgi:hypothetical protein
MDPAHNQVAEPGDLDDELRSLAGSGAVFCGHVARGENSKSVNDRALQAFRKKRAFYVVYDGWGYSPFSRVGLAGDTTGQMWEVMFESMAYTYVPPRGKLSDNSHILTVPCPTPYHLRKYAHGGQRPQGWKPGRQRRLTCLRLVKEK